MHASSSLRLWLAVPASGQASPSRLAAIQIRAVNQRRREIRTLDRGAGTHGVAGGRAGGRMFPPSQACAYIHTYAIVARQGVA